MDLYGKYPQSVIVGPTVIKVGPTSLTNFGFKICWTWQPWRNGDGHGGREGRREQGGQRGLGSKRSPFEEDVSEYWESYEGDSAN